MGRIRMGVCGRHGPIKPGLPKSLCDALNGWISSMATPDEDLAEFAGWPVERVAQARDF